MPFWVVFLTFLGFDAIAAVTLLPESPAMFWIITGLLWALYLGVFFFPSLYFDLRKPGLRLAAYYIGTSERTYVTDTDRADLVRRYTDAHRDVNTELLPYLGRGLAWLGLSDIVYLQWPFYSAVPVTTATLRIPITAADGVWTAEQELHRTVTTQTVTVHLRKPDGSPGRVLNRQETKHESDWKVTPATAPRPRSTATSTTQVNVPANGQMTETAEKVEVHTRQLARIQLFVDGEVFIRLGVNIGPLLLALPDAPLNRVSAPDVQPAAGQSTGPSQTPATTPRPEGLEDYLARKIRPLVHEAIRDAVAGFDRHCPDGTVETITGLTWEGPQDDAIRRRRLIEVRVRELLGSRESILTQSGLLRMWDGDPNTHDSGPAAAGFDLAIEHVAPKNPKLQEAIDNVAVELKNADAARFKGAGIQNEEAGRTAALADRKTKLDVTGPQVLGHDFGTRTQANLFLAAPDLIAAGLSFIELSRQGRGRRLPNPQQAAGGGQPPAQGQPPKPQGPGTGGQTP